jgi:hypothetical protein
VRQFFLPRFWLALGALAALFIGLQAVFSDDNAISAVVDTEEIGPRRVDTISPVFSIEAAPGFAINAAGVTTTEMRLFLDGVRVMVIHRGTPGEIRCAELAEIGRCVVVADLLGDAVVWFALIPAERRPTVTLPPLTSVGDDGYVLLDNGWEVRHAPRVERRCTEDTLSLSEFIRRFGSKSTSTFSFEQQAIVRVTCVEPS